MTTLEQARGRSAFHEPVEVLQLQDKFWSANVVVDVTDRAIGLSAAVACPVAGDWREWFAGARFESANTSSREYLKYSTSVEIFRDRIPTGDSGGAIDVVCKRYKGRGVLERFRASRANRNFRRGWMLLDAGIHTATPLAVIERFDPARESIVVTQFVSNLMDLDRIAMLELPRLSGRQAAALKRALIEQIARLFAKFRAARLHHRDMKASNIMVANANTPETASLCILDLDGLGAASRWRRGQRWQPLMRLAASLVDYRGVTRADFARCLRRYLILTDGNDREWKVIYRQLSVQAQSYAVASRGRKRGKLDGIA